MILAGKKRAFSYLSLLWVLPLLAVLSLFFIPDAPKVVDDPKSETPGNYQLFFCDLEHEEGGVLKHKDREFEGFAFRADDVAYSGDFSIALSAGRKYGLTTIFNPTIYDATYHLSVKRYNPENLASFLVAASPGNKELYVSQGQSNNMDKNGWESLHLIFQIPSGLDSLVIYCYVADATPGLVYFDDLELRVSDLEEVGKGYNLTSMDITLSEESFQKITAKRRKAWEVGILESDEKDWVKTKILVDGDELKGKLRLKGDWLDHLRGNKWSFRIKLKEPDAFKRMLTFNIQKPDTRGFLREWVYHKVLEEHDVLTPRYDFVVANLNGKALGFYALEEHFEKQLVESRSRRQGPILKFSESRMWEGVKRQFAELGKNQFVIAGDKQDSYEGSPIEAFSEEDYLENPALKTLLDRGHELLSAFRSGLLPLDQIFDVDRMGKFLAIVELCGAYHNLTWHNLRWYYNPLSDRLEPIGFDGFTDQFPTLGAGISIIAEGAYSNHEAYEPYKNLFTNDEIVKAYVHYVDSICTRSYLEGFYLRHNDHLGAYKKALEAEFINSVFDRKELNDRAIRSNISIRAFEQSVHCYEHGNDSLYVINHHRLPVKVVPSGDVIYPALTPAHGSLIARTMHDDTVSFHVLGLPEETYPSPVRRLAAPGHSAATLPATTDHPLLGIDSFGYVLLPGTTSTPIITPAGSTLTMPSGCRVTLNKNAYILVDGDLMAQGSEDSPVVIHSEDGTGALVVRHGKIKSKVSYSIFRGLGAVQTDGMSLPGAVNFYNTSVDFENCVFENNTGEDALNTVRSEFRLANCLFRNTAYDAFDSDFCQGEVYDCRFQNTGNDALDFSGSIVRVISSTLKDIGDKGLSVGEESSLKIDHVSITNATIGVASKDLSSAEIKSIELQNIGTGFTAFQKKPEFGPASITIYHHNEKKVDRLHLAEQGSTITFSNLVLQ